MNAGRWLCALTLLAFLAPAAARSQTLDDPLLDVAPVVSAGLIQPTALAFVAPGDMLVTQKTGQVRRILDGVLASSPVLTVPVNIEAERGLLGIAVNTESPPKVFLYFTEAATPFGSPVANRVYRYDWNAGAAALQNPVLVLDLPVLTGTIHNGGVLALGPPGQAPGFGDGALLHAVIGDVLRQGQLQNVPAGPPPDDSGVVLRVRQDGSAAPGNPFAPYCSVTTTTTCSSSAGCPGGEVCRLEVARYYAYGVRNSFGLTLDPATGAVWDTENGPDLYDEVNRVTPGMNSGWRPIMGPDARDLNGVGDLFQMPGAGQTYSDPEFSWLATIAPTAIAFPVGSALGPAYDGVALVGDANLGQIHALPLNGARTGFDVAGIAGLADLVADDVAERDALRFGQGFGTIVDLEFGPDGLLYVVTIFPGAVYRVRSIAEIPALPGWGAAALAALLCAGLVASAPQRGTPRGLRALLLLALLAPAAARAQSLDDQDLDLELVTSGLALPTTMAFVAPDDILVLEKNTGRVRRVLNGALAPAPVLTVPVNFAVERGLLGIAVNSESPPKVFLYYTEAASLGAAPIANRVYRYDWNAGASALQNPQLVLDLPVLNGPIHNAGVLVLGPPGQAPGVGDGALLYAVIGDLNRAGQLQNVPGGAPPDDSGVILRVRQDGTPAPGNPFTPYCEVSTGTTCTSDASCPGGETCRLAVARYVAYGVRNSFGLALDPVSGDLWDTENGPGNYDEINRVLPGMNSGWNPIMGPDARDPNGVGELFQMPGAGPTYSDPEFSWFDTNAPTGIVFPAGSSLGPAYDDAALVGDNNYHQLYAFPLNGARTGFDLAGITGLADLVSDSDAERDAVRFGQGFGAVTDLEMGPDGHLYVVSFTGGAIYRISGSPGVPALPAWGAAAVFSALLAAAVPLCARSSARGSKA